jgi:cytoskeletal protein RodZ
MNESGKKNAPDQGNAVLEQEQADSMTVGQILKNEREQRGLNLTSVSKELMIRKFYLGALEDGRYAELPDTVYALGFVKSYAELMGLDEGPLVAQFKRERGDGTRPELSFPDPLQESKMPSKTIVMGGVAAAAGLLFLWAHIAGEDKSNALETVPQPPEKTIATPLSAEPSQEIINLNAPEGVEKAQIQIPVSDTDQKPTDVQQSESLESWRQQDVAPAPSPTPEVDDLPLTDGTAENVEPSSLSSQEVIKPRMPEVTAIPQQSSPQENEKTQEQDSIKLLPPSDDTLVTSSDDERVADRAVPDRSMASPNVINPDRNRESRVTIVATQESWVEIRDRNGRLLLTRVLQPGQRYDVPDEKGVTMITGNAGGIYLVVDGEKQSALGKPAAVRRNIQLDADLF